MQLKHRAKRRKLTHKIARFKLVEKLFSGKGKRQTTWSGSINIHNLFMYSILRTMTCSYDN